jgi:hypothetical protein
MMEQTREAVESYIACRPGGAGWLPSSFGLIPGMAVTAEIKAGRRTILSYLMHPAAWSRRKPARTFRLWSERVADRRKTDTGARPGPLNGVGVG